ncbi:MAG: Flp family type IVb pilin [Acidobacteria bacterium]|nr:Flp family type IVb pilin [Acidobacteriota bacterium]
MNLLKKFWNEEDGQDLIEYALLAGALCLGMVTAVKAFGTDLTTTYTNIGTQVKALPPGGGA